MACVTLDAVVLRDYDRDEGNEAPTLRSQPAPGKEKVDGKRLISRACGRQLNISCRYAWPKVAPKPK